MQGPPRNNGFRGVAVTAPASTTAAVSPTQPVPGNSNPAAVTGDAQPMIPSGGKIPKAKPAGMRHQKWCCLGAHNSGHALERNTAAKHQREIGVNSDVLRPRKDRAAGITAQLPAA